MKVGSDQEKHPTSHVHHMNKHPATCVLRLTGVRVCVHACMSARACMHENDSGRMLKQGNRTLADDKCKMKEY